VVAALSFAEASAQANLAGVWNNGYFESAR